MTSSTTQTTTSRNFKELFRSETKYFSKIWHSNSLKIFLICSIDLWNLYLHFRQLEFIFSKAVVPEELADALSQAEYFTLRRRAMFFILLSIYSLGGRLYSHAFYTAEGLAPLTWQYTLRHTHNPDNRAIIFSALDDFSTKIIVVPLIVVLSLFHDGLKVNLLGVAIAGVLWLAGSVITTALRTTVMVKATNRYGTDFFIYLAFLYEAVTIVGKVIFIQILAHWMLSPLPEGPAKSAIEEVTLKAGYSPKHVVYFEPNVEGRYETDPNAYHAGLLGTSLIVVSETLLKMVGPTDIGAVVAHELGHWTYSHSAYTYSASVLTNISFMILSIWSYGNKEVYDTFKFDMTDLPHPIIGTLLISKYFFTIGGLLAGFSGIMGYFCEFAADDFAVKMGLGSELRRSLVSLVSRMKTFPGVDSWYAAWFRAHPSMVLRIAQLS